MIPTSLFLAQTDIPKLTTVEQVVAEWTKAVVDYLPKFVLALVILLAGLWLARLFTNFFRRVLTSRHVDRTLNSFLAQLLYWLLIVVVLVSALDRAGMPMTSVMTVLGASALAIGLALQSSLSNFAAGVMIILFRYFRVGDNIETDGIAGTVEVINIFDTHLLTADNRKIIIPNSKIIGAPITNASAYPTQRLDLVFGIGYDSDLPKAKEMVKAILQADARVLKEPAPEIVVGNLGESTMDLYVRPWVKTSDHWAVRCHLLETVKLRFDDAGIALPFPQHEVHVRQGQ